MSNPANAQSSYSPPTQPAVFGAYSQQVPRASAPLDRGVLRQILFGGVVVVGIAVVSNLLSIVGSSVYALDGELILSLFWNVFIAVVFVAGAGVSALFLSPFAKATSALEVLKKLGIAAAIGAAALFVLNFVWSVANAGQYLVQMIISSGILGSISSGLTYGAFFALGVLVARMLPPRPQGFVGQPQGYYGQSVDATRVQQSTPQGSWQSPPPGEPAPQGYAPVGTAVPGSPTTPQAYEQAYAPAAGQQVQNQQPYGEQAYAPAARQQRPDEQPYGGQAHVEQPSYGDQAYGQRQAPAAPQGQPPVNP